MLFKKPKQNKTKQIKTYHIKTNQNKGDAMKDKTNLWQVFIAEYPEGKGADTTQAREAWRELFPDDKPKVIEGLRAWNGSNDWKERRYIPNAENFIKTEKWKLLPNDYDNPFKPNEETKPLSQDQLFARRHIGTQESYFFYQKAQRIDTWTKEKGLKL